jgi:hypothetical protein
MTMNPTLTRAINLGDLGSFVLHAPVKFGVSDYRYRIARSNAAVFRDALARYDNYLDEAQIKAPNACGPLKDLEQAANSHWNRVHEAENRNGIDRLVQFYAGVPFKVGIWLDGRGRFTDLRFGYWSLHSLHIGSSIYNQAHAVALMMPGRDGAYFPMEAYFLDLHRSVRETMAAWFKRYGAEQWWHQKLDNRFKVKPFVRTFMDGDNMKRANGPIAHANTAHFHALRAPLGFIPDEAHRALPGSDAEARAVRMRDDGTSKLFAVRRERTPQGTIRKDREPYAKYFKVPLNKPYNEKPHGPHLPVSQVNANLLEAARLVYNCRMNQKGLSMRGPLAVLAPLMEDADEHWKGIDPTALRDIKRFIEFRVGVPFKAALWFAGNKFSDIRLNQWGGYMLHFGVSTLGGADAVAYLIPYGDSFIPMRAVAKAPLVVNGMNGWLDRYRDAQFHYVKLARKFGIWEFLEARRKQYRAMHTMCAIAGICHMQEVSAPLLGYPSDSSGELPYGSVALHCEGGRYVMGVPEGKSIQVDDTTYGPGLHEASAGSKLHVNGQNFHMHTRGLQWFSR